MRYWFSLTAALNLCLAGGTFAADGAALFKQNCSSCHGDAGKADKPASKTLKITPIAGDAKLAGMDEADIVAKVKSNDKHKSVVQRLTDADVAAVAAYVKGLAAGK